MRYRIWKSIVIDPYISIRMVKINVLKKFLLQIEKHNEIEVSYVNGHLTTVTSKEDKVEIVQILNHIKLADDCHSFNAILQSGRSVRTMKMSTTQTVAKGDKLLLWFTPELLTTMGVPFLTPVNIQGIYFLSWINCFTSLLS